ncbi:MAG: hypothetical protein FJW90_06825 [Actinobacteria bacterium]|nr:hypothetical protein [Actinomycetota bacterium]
MKPEWPLYGLGALAGTLIGVASDVFGWTDETVSWVAAGVIAALLFTYLPLMDRRRGRSKTSARS